MYPKTTYFFQQNAKLHPPKEEKLAFADQQKSNLLYHNRESMDYQFFDIKVPYIIIYEAVNLKTNSTIYMEFSEDGQINFHSPYSEYIKINRQLHSHDFFEITYVLSGRLTMQIEDERICYEAGECCLCNKNIHHVEQMDEDTEIVLLLLKERVVKELLYEGASPSCLRENTAKRSVFNRFFVENRQNPLYDAKVYADFRAPNQALRNKVLHLINSMIEEITSDHLGKGYMMRALMCRFLELMETAPEYRSQVHSAKLSREEQIVYMIARAYQNSTNILSRTDVERLTGYCGDHVERIIKQHTGLTLSQYGRLFLLQKAALLLKESEKSVNAICEELGYTNRTYFNTIFRHRYGVTPAEYRKQHRVKS